jgi:hypothetical protein
VAGPLRTCTGFLCCRRLESCHIQMHREAPASASASVRNARARSFLTRYTRCNACIATATNVHVRFRMGDGLVDATKGPRHTV